jgi:hypothetical protein
MPNIANDETLADDLLSGAKEIADFLGFPERKTRHQLDHDQIPHRRMGRLIVGSKRVLRRHFSTDKTDKTDKEAT